MNWKNAVRYGGTMRHYLIQLVAARHDEEEFQRELEIQAFEHWQHSVEVVDPRILEKLTRALQELR